MAEIQQWEYQSVSVGTFWTDPKDEEIENVLNQMGAEGWEVISVTARYGTNVLRVLAKRPLPESSDRPRRWPQY